MARISEASEAPMVIAKCLPVLFKADAIDDFSAGRPRMISVLIGL